MSVCVPEIVSCPAEVVPTEVMFADWAGWVGSNVGIGALAPIVVLILIAGFRRMTRTHTKAKPLQFFAAFSDGQLGYVGLGWAAGAFAELWKKIASLPSAPGEMTVCLVVISLIAALNGYNAGVNAVGVEPLVNPPDLSIWTLNWWFDRYFAFTASLIVVVVTLVIAGWAHRLAG